MEVRLQKYLADCGVASRRKAEELIKNAYSLDNVYQGVVLNEILSRKKQMVPNIMNVLERM